MGSACQNGYAERVVVHRCNDLKRADLSRTVAKTRSLRPTASFPWSYAVVALGCGLVLVGLASWNNGTLAWQRPGGSKLKQADIPFDGERAYRYLKEICAIGPRVSGTEGMR